MPDSTRYKIVIEQDGVCTHLKVRGKKRYLRERQFLAELLGLRPDQAHVLQDTVGLAGRQAAAYAAFRKELDRAERQGL